MKNSAYQGGCYQQRPKAEVDNILRDLQNYSYPTKAEFNHCFIIHSKYFLVLTGVSPFRYLFFHSPNVTQPCPQVFSVNGAIICSGLHSWRHFDVIGSTIFGGLHFWRHWFNIWSTAAGCGELTPVKNLSETEKYFELIIALIVSITKFSIAIGSPRAYLSRNRRDHVGVRLQVSDLNFFKSDTCNWIPTWFSRQLRAL